MYRLYALEYRRVGDGDKIPDEDKLNEKNLERLLRKSGALKDKKIRMVTHDNSR